MPAFKGTLTAQADRRCLRLRREGDRRQPVRLTLSLPDGFPARRPGRRDRFRPHARVGRAVCGRGPWTRFAPHARAGLDVIVVTGRMVQSVRRFLEPAALARAGHLLPGCGRRGRRREVAAARADPARARARGDRARRGRGLRPQRLRRRRAVRLRARRKARASTRASSTWRSTRSGTCSTWLDEPPTKLVCVGEPAELDGVEERMKAHFGDRLYISKSLPYFLEFAAAGVTKGAGLDFLAAHMGFTPRADDRLRRRRERRRARRMGHVRHRRRERACPREGGRRLDLPLRGRGRCRTGARGASRLEAMIDLRAARNDPDALPGGARAQGRGRGLRRAARRRCPVARAPAAGGRAAGAHEAERQADPGAARRADRGQGRAAAARGRAEPRTSAAPGCSIACRTPRPRTRPTATRRRTPSWCGSSASRRASTSSRAIISISRPPTAGSTSSAAQRCRARASCTASATSALLEIALYRWALARDRAEGPHPMLPPVLVRDEAMYGTGFFPSDKGDFYEVARGRALPHRHLGGAARRLSRRRGARRSCRCATSRSRRASGARRARRARTRAGCSACTSSTRSRCSSSASRAPRATSTSGCSTSRRSSSRSSACRIASLNIAAGDLGASAAKKYDIEAWFPGQSRYREITSTSNTTDFQARRLKISYRPATASPSRCTR